MNMKFGIRSSYRTLLKFFLNQIENVEMVNILNFLYTSYSTMTHSELVIVICNSDLQINLDSLIVTRSGSTELP